MTPDSTSGTNPTAHSPVPAPVHVEGHFTAGDLVRDIVIGMSDGLTVPFALAAGLSGAVAASRLVVTAGLAEVAAGSVAMGLGGFLAARGDADHYRVERAREEREVVEKPEAERAEVREIFEEFGLTPAEAELVTQSLAQNPKQWVDFMMRFELGLEEPEPKRAYNSALTIAASYIAAGMVPLSPYFFFHNARQALPISVGLTLVALVAFGWAKGYFTGAGAGKSASQTALVGGVAAAAAFFIARAVGG